MPNVPPPSRSRASHAYKVRASHADATGLVAGDATIGAADADFMSGGVAGSGLSGSVNGALLVKGSVTAEHIAAGSITTDRLEVGAGRNLLVNGTFESFDGPAGLYSNPSSMTGWTAAGSQVLVGASITSWAKSGQHCLIIKNAGAASNWEGVYQLVPVSVGRRYRLSGWTWKGAGSGQAAAIYAHGKDKDGTTVVSNAMYCSTNATTTPVYGEAYYTVPDGLGITHLMVQCRWNTVGTTSEVFAFEDVMLEEVPAGFSNSDATVVIDDTGITVENGKIVIKDENAVASLNSAGFAGAWVDFVRLGLYNARFAIGTNGSLPAGRTASMPYWTIGTQSTNATVAKVAGVSGRVGGLEWSFSALNGYHYINSDAVPVHAGYEYALAFIASLYPGASGLGNVTITPYLQYYDASGSAIGSAVYLSGQALSSTAPEVRVSATTSEAPGDAASVKVGFKVQEVSGHASDVRGRLHSVLFAEALALPTMYQLAAGGATLSGDIALTGATPQVSFATAGARIVEGSGVLTIEGPSSSTTPVALGLNAQHASATSVKQELRVSGTTRATIRASSSSNLVMQGVSTGATYLNWDSGSGGTYFGDGSLTQVARIDSAGNIESTTGRLRLKGYISPASLTADQNNWNPTGLAGASVIRIATDATPRTITGIVAGADGDILYLHNTNTATAITLAHAVTSTAANQFACPGATNYSLAARRTVMLWYDATYNKWLVMAP